MSRPSWLVTYRDGLPVHRWSPILVLTGSDATTLIEANALPLSQTVKFLDGSVFKNRILTDFYRASAH